MRVKPLLLLLIPFVTAPAGAQTWEKLVAPGLVYRMEVDLAKPLVVNALRYSPGSGVTMRPEPTQAPMFASVGRSGAEQGNGTVRSAAERLNAAAGVNGDFFFAGQDPVGTLVREGELLSQPYPTRSCFAWGPGFTSVSALSWEGKVTTAAGEELKLDGLNEACPPNGLVLSTEAAGSASSHEAATFVVIEGAAKVKPTGTYSCKVVSVVKDKTECDVPTDKAVLTGTGLAALKLGMLKAGDKVVVNVQTNGFDWTKAQNVIGGGPTLVVGGQRSVDAKQEGFKPDFLVRHPRTAIGATKDGDIWVVAVDGRSKVSRGATLEELADIMVRLGCVKAINLDGGGSTTMYAAGEVLNRPSDGVERAVGDGVFFFGVPAPWPTDTDFVIQGVPKLSVGSPARFSLIGGNGEKIPNASVIWSATGAGWIDQAGLLRGVSTGEATVFASVGGKVVSLKVEVEGTSPGNPVKKPVSDAKQRVPPSS